MLRAAYPPPHFIPAIPLSLGPHILIWNVSTREGVLRNQPRTLPIHWSDKFKRYMSSLSHTFNHCIRAFAGFIQAFFYHFIRGEPSAQIFIRKLIEEKYFKNDKKHTFVNCYIVIAFDVNIMFFLLPSFFYYCYWIIFCVILLVFFVPWAQSTTFANTVMCMHTHSDRDRYIDK